MGLSKNFRGIGMRGRRRLYTVIVRGRGKVAAAAIVVVIATQFSACSYSTFFIPKQTKVYAPTAPDNIAISTQHELTVPYEKLGRVAVIVWGSGEGARSELQDQASKLGANAVIGLRVDRSFGRTAASGMAVRVFSKQ